jgi:hypothetical protein
MQSTVPEAIITATENGMISENLLGQGLVNPVGQGDSAEGREKGGREERGEEWHVRWKGMDVR